MQKAAERQCCSGDFLTARGQEEDRLKGYLLGCDDYVVKPLFAGGFICQGQGFSEKGKGDGA